MHNPAALSDMLLDIPSSSTLLAATGSSPHTDKPVTTSAPICSALTEAAYCAAAEQLHTAVQQAAQLYTQACTSTQHAADGDAHCLYSGLPELSVDTDVSTAGRQQASWSSRQTDNDAADALVRHAIRRMPSSASTSAAAWVLQGSGTSASPDAGTQDAIDHTASTGTPLDRIAAQQCCVIRLDLVTLESVCQAQCKVPACLLLAMGHPQMC